MCVAQMSCSATTGRLILPKKAVDKEGWFATGDLVCFDGPHLFVVGRAKEMIIRSGFNVLSR